MKKLITKKTLILSLLGLLVSMGIRAEDVTGVSLSAGAVTLNVNADSVIIATIIPENATDKSVTWKIESSTSEDVIEIDTVTPSDKTHCKVIAKNAGEATLTVTTYDGPFRASCVITVVKRVMGMALKDHAMNLILGEDTVLKAGIDPVDAMNPAVEWVSRDSLIVDIESTEENRTDTVCKIIPLKPGSTWIVAKTVEGEIEDSCLVTVNSAPIIDFTLSDDTIDLFVGDEVTITGRIRPLEGTYKYVKWVNTNFPAENIVKIISAPESVRDTICRIEATGVGLAEIVAETYGGLKKDTCVIRVKGIPVESLTLPDDTIDLWIGNTTRLNAVIAPEHATNDSVRWTSSDSTRIDILSTAANRYDTVCEIKALRSGGAMIYAVAVDSMGAEHSKDSCYVRVVVPADSIVLRAEIFRSGGFVEETTFIGDGQRGVHLDLVADSILRLTAKVYPDSATEAFYCPLLWENLDPDLVRIDSIPDDSICYLTALRSGVDTIYATTADRSVSSRFYYIHIAPRKVDSIGIKINDHVVGDTVFLDVHDSFQLTTAVYPWNATNDTLNLVSTDAEIVQVDSTSNGVFINGLKEGVAVIRALATDSDRRKDSCIVQVRNVPATGVDLNRDTVYLYENHIGTLIASISPANATGKTVTWSSSKDDVAEIISATDTVCVFKGLKADTAVIRAVNGGFKDSCVVIVLEQFMFVESDTTAANPGKIALSLKLPDDVTLTGSFRLLLPKGFGLTLKAGGGYRTEPEAPYKESSDLTIMRENDSTYLFEISLKTSPASGLLRSVPEKRKVMDIAYTIYDNSLENSTAVYDVRFVSADFKLSNDTEIKEEHSAKIKVFKDGTGNEVIESRNRIAYLIDKNLYVHSAKAETVSVYSLNGNLLFSKDKAEGQAVFNLDTQEKILVVRGGSGWAQIVVSQ